MSRKTTIGGALPPDVTDKVAKGLIPIEVDPYLDEASRKLLGDKSDKELVAIVSGRGEKDSNFKWLVVEKDDEAVLLTDKRSKARKDKAEALARLDRTATALESLLPGIEMARKKAEHALNRSSCAGCQLRNVMQRYVREALSLAGTSANEADLLSLQGTIDSSDFDYVSRLSFGTASPGGPETRNHAVAIPESYGGPRPSCLDCCRKHLGKAISQLGEAALGYPDHFWLAMANLSEMEEESLAEYPDFAAMVREIRIEMTENRDYKPNLMELFGMIDDLAGVEPEEDDTFVEIL